ncbi:MAG: RNA methyltransferase [Inquilinus sp.]|nr:RNA methyltransferase [Inquilinus sp.]
MAGTDKTKQAAAALGWPAVILVEPQLGENIGAVARAMLNCGLTDLRLVRPRDGWPNPQAHPRAAGADSVLDAARVFDRLAEAIAGLAHLYATTARPRDIVKPVLVPREAAAAMRAQAARGEAVGLLFGGERSGLQNDDLTFADTIVTVPLNPAFASLNLAQAVLLIAHEWFQAGAVPEPGWGEAPPADKDKLVNLFAHLEQELDAAEFFTVAEKRPSMVHNLRNMLQRARLTEQEVGTLHGVVTALTGRRKDGRPRGRG